MTWRASSGAGPLVEDIAEGHVWMSRVFCCCVVMIFLLRKSLGARRFQRARLLQEVFDRSKARWKRRVPRDDFHSFENTGYASLGSAPGFAGRLFDRRRARWYRCVPYEMGRMKRAGRKDAGLLQSRPMSPSKAVVNRNVAKATLQKPWKTDPSC